MKEQTLPTENFLLENNFIKTNGKFGEYFYHERYQLFRCWFYEGNLKIGKKDDSIDMTICIATIYNEKDFSDLFRILTSETLIK